MLAWLIKNGRSGELMRNIVREDGIQPLVTMVTSEHVVMQNEALVALTLISSSILGIYQYLTTLQHLNLDFFNNLTTLLNTIIKPVYGTP